MNIYSPITITENCIKNFVPTRLYIKKHSITGLRYLGKSSKEDLSRYLGSGKRWSNHIKFHDKEYVTTEWVSDWFNDPYSLQDLALFISECFDIVNSDKWANLKPEYGIEGHKLFGKSNGMFGTSRKGEDNPFYKKKHSKESKSKMGPAKGYKKAQHLCEKQSEFMKLNNPMNNPDSVQKIRQKAIDRPKKYCVNCNRYFDTGNYAKSHGDKCKNKLTSS